ncbi:MAG: hypothetical protein NZ455_09705 [Bacteroidia bacterium]|nr:hypothetical protein [Bacteroidia bacterium]MDW8345916.1 hypothetical protein [Bacteroidia bacterium]
MRRACVSTVRSTEAIAQPVARRPEAQRRDTPKSIYLTLLSLRCIQRLAF